VVSTHSTRLYRVCAAVQEVVRGAKPRHVYSAALIVVSQQTGQEHGRRRSMHGPGGALTSQAASGLWGDRCADTDAAQGHAAQAGQGPIVDVAGIVVSAARSFLSTVSGAPEVNSILSCVF